MSVPRVVVTGVGAVTPLGIGVEESFARLIAGESGIDWVREPLPPDLRVRFAGSVKGFQPTDYLDAKTAKRTGRTAQLAVAAAHEAMRSARLETGFYDSRKVGVLTGVAFGDQRACFDEALALWKEGPSRVSPFGISTIAPNMTPFAVARLVGARGPTFSIASACASGAHAIGEALFMLRAHRVDVAYAGGSDAMVHPLPLSLFARMCALARPTETSAGLDELNPSEASRPFERRRNGFVLAEGAGVLVLERLESALARNAPIYGEIAGYGSSSEAFDPVLPDPTGIGMIEAMQGALADARLSPSEVEYVSAHATSTPAGDRVETLALKQVFENYASRLWISATKSATGHPIGAAGALECIFTLLALRDGVAPPTLNLREPDPACDLDYVPLHARRAPLRVALSNSFAFGGQGAALALRRYDG